MNPEKDTKTNKDLSDMNKPTSSFLLLKLDKLCTAIYLVSSFISDSEPLKWRLRDRAVELITKISTTGQLDKSYSFVPLYEVAPLVKQLISLINLGLDSGTVSVMNFSLLKKELADLDRQLVSMEVEQFAPNQEQFQTKSLPLVAPRGVAIINPRNKVNLDNNRRDLILSFIRQHGWSAIKDIATAAPSYGLKTIQRELSQLVNIGKLKKKGDRRWSRYQLA